MKKTAYLFIFSAGLLVGCHSNKSDNQNSSVTVIDTSKIHAAPKQAPDTAIKDGQVIKRYENGVMKEKSFYISGKRQGECQSFFPNGKLWSDDYFADGLLDGPTASYYDNGQKRYEGAYTKGKPSGIWNFYDNKGKVTSTVNYTKK
jgi:antitoxin component YwqK of YwqJK toxin-antitoxin module